MFPFCLDSFRFPRLRLLVPLPLGMMFLLLWVSGTGQRRRRAHGGCRHQNRTHKHASLQTAARGQPWSNQRGPG